MASKEDITLFRGWLDPGKHVWSPFVVKVEARLRFAGISYVTEAGSTRTAPRGKIPYLERRTPGSIEIFSDSTLIISRLSENGTIPDLNASLPADVKAQDLGLRALLEDRLYFYHTFERWIQNYYTMRDHILWSMPYLPRVLVGILIYRNTTKHLHGQGTGRFTPEEIASFRAEIWESFNQLLVSSKTKSSSRKEPFWVLGGPEPTEADCSLFGFIVSVLICTAAPDSQRVVRSYPVLVEYVGRIHDQYFPDYEKWAQAV